MRAAGQPVPPRRPGWRTRLLCWLARHFGSQFVVPTVAAREQADRTAYDAQPDARVLAAERMADRAHALDTLSRKALGIDPGELGGSAWEAAFTSLLLFAVGAIIPVAPFSFLAGPTAVVTSMAVSAAALTAIGAAITLLTGRGVIYSGLRELSIRLAAAGLTDSIGRLIGISLVG